MNRLRIGKGCQVAGLVLIVTAVLLLSYLWTRPPGDWPRAHHRHLYCSNNLKQIGLSFTTWALDNNGQFPFNVSTNAGGTMEFCATGADGFDTNAARHFQVMSNELSTPILLVCPKDWATKPALRFHNLQANNISYRLRSGSNLNESNPTAVLLLCPFDGNAVHYDGSVTAGKADWKPPKRALMEVVRYKYLDWMSMGCAVFMVTGVVLLWAGSRVTWKVKGGLKPMGLIIGEALLVIVALLFIGLMLIGTARFY